VSLSARLDRVLPGLTARQRAVLVLRALAAGQEPDTSLRDIGDLRERRAFNRYMGLLYVVNSELDGMLHGVLYALERLAARRSLELLREAGALAAADLGEQADPSVVRNWRKAKAVSVTEFLLGVAEDVRAQELAELLSLWREFRSLEAVWRELAAEFDGESLLLPELRARAERVLAELQAQGRRLAAPRRLPGADEATVAQVRDRVERAFAYLGVVEVGGSA
jgi:hypothetical protein